jgi:hypothetical protein
MRLTKLFSVLAVAPALLVVTPASVVATPAAAASTPGSTVVAHVRPVDRSGHLRPGYRVVQRLGKASCSFGSESTGTAYRCFAGHFVVDPCWVAANRHYVDCLAEPWSHKVVRLHVTKGYDNTGYTRKAGRGSDPWGVQTVAGVRCGWLQGASGVVGKFRINYGCGKTTKTVLIGDVDRAPALWTIRKAVNTGSFHYQRDGRVALQKAWYGKPSRKG